MIRARAQFQCDTFSLVRFDHPLDVPHTDPPEELNENYSLIFVQRGGFTLSHHREEMQFSTGDLFVLTPGLRHRYSHATAHPDDVCISLIFEPETGEQMFGLNRSVLRRLPKSNRSRYLHSHICNLISTRGRGFAEDGFLNCIRMLLTNSAGSEHHLYKLNQLHWYAGRIDLVRELMDSHSAEPHSLASLARTAGMSRLHFAHVFRELMGVSAYAYLLRRRLELAAKLLKSGASVTEACFTVGFNNLSHFTRTFRRHFGIRPSQFTELN
jgi:AraC-like DNA-binding protein